jgi:PPE-repeat protein
MSFSLIPPEINSALMYSGAGSGPLLEAATAWDELAADLEATATQYQTAITNLTTGTWLGPSSTQMATAAEPYIAWLQSTAAEAAQTGAQAKAAAAAYGTAYSSMVPPPVISANRAELTTLVSNNFLGQNTGAIANAPMVTSGAAPAAAAAASSATSSTDTLALGFIQAVADLFGYTGNAPADLSATSLAAWLPGVTTALAANPSAALLPVQATYYMGMLGSTPARMFMSGGGGSGAGALSGDALNGMKDSMLASVGKLIDDKAGSVMSGVTGQLGKWGAGIQSGIQAQMASAMHAGGLSVPHGWHTGAPGSGMDRAAPLLPTNSVAAPSMTTGLPTSPFSQGLMGALAGRGMTAMGSKVAAKVMPRSPAGG